MAASTDTNDKTQPTAVATDADVEQQDVNTTEDNRRRIFGRPLPKYASPIVQLVIVSCILFLNPGMYNALAGLGGAGQVDPRVQNLAGIALNAVFAPVAFVIGIVHNYIGTKWTMTLGGCGYFIYAASFLCYNHTQNEGFVIFAGGLLGACASALWCAQGVVMMSYPTETQRGRAISLTWFVFNMGAVIGASVSLAQNWNNTAGTVTDGTYIGFIVLQVCGAVLCCTLVPSIKVVRTDGTRVQKVTHPGLKEDIVGLYTTLVRDPWVFAIFPMFFASNYFYTYQFNNVNAYWFSTRTRAFNSIWYWLSQIITAAAFGALLDWTRFSRRTRAFMGWAVLFVAVMAVYGGGFEFLKKTNRSVPGPRMDMFDSGYIWHLFLYMAYGSTDALWQVFCYYTMGAMSNDPRKLAYYAGFYKSIQSLGQIVISRLDASEVSFNINFGTTWGFMAGSMILALPLYIWRLNDTELTETEIAEVQAIAEEKESHLLEGEVKEDTTLSKPSQDGAESEDGALAKEAVETKEKPNTKE